MKKHLTTLLFICYITTSFAQTWQWGKRGGSMGSINSSGSGGRQEEAYSIVTDSQKNIYLLSVVGSPNIDFDGHPDENYEPSSTNFDIALVSFSCDGSFRWSKIIGSASREDFDNLVIDSQDNIYLAGKFGSYSDLSAPQHIDDDVTMSTDPPDYSMLVIMKFNNAGVLQWYKKPEPNDQSFFNKSLSSRLEIDANNNLYWLVALSQPGTYADGAFTVNDISKLWHVLKYNSSGDFVSNIVLDLRTPSTFGSMKFYRNPYNQNLFVSGRSLGDANSTWAIVGTEPVTHSMFVGCFAPNGQALWKRENTSTMGGTIQLYDLLFDSENNIYTGGRFFAGSDSFMGFSVPGFMIPGFVMKIDEMATTTIWGNYNNRGAYGFGALALNGNEVAFTDFCGGTDFTWGNQTLNATGENQGNDVLFARFDKNTGACLSLKKIPGNVGYEDYGCSIAVDASGDYIVGGNFSGTLTFDGGAQITNVGGPSDFFVAKFATQTCSPLSTEIPEFDNLTYYPNPTTGILKIETPSHLNYELYDLKGGLVGQGVIDGLQPTIDLSGLAVGTYVLKLNDGQAVRTVKVIKR